MGREKYSSAFFQGNYIDLSLQNLVNFFIILFCGIFVAVYVKFRANGVNFVGMGDKLLFAKSAVSKYIVRKFDSFFLR